MAMEPATFRLVVPDAKNEQRNRDAVNMLVCADGLR